MRTGLGSSFRENREKYREICNIWSFYNGRDEENPYGTGVSLTFQVLFLQGKTAGKNREIRIQYQRENNVERWENPQVARGFCIRSRSTLQAVYQDARMQTFDPTTVLDGRKCRTVRDALDWLAIPDVEREAVATIYAREISCPNGQTPGMVLIATGSHEDCDRQYLRLPDSNAFRGRLADGTSMHGAAYEIDRASVASDGTVLLFDGREIRGVAFQRGVQYRHYDFTLVQHYVVRLALQLIGEEDRGYRSSSEQLLPGIKSLDYGAIQGIRIPHLKKLLDVIHKISDLRVSKVEIESTLRLAGMQFPRARRRPCSTL